MRTLDTFLSYFIRGAGTALANQKSQQYKNQNVLGKTTSLKVETTEFYVVTVFTIQDLKGGAEFFSIMSI